MDFSCICRLFDVSTVRTHVCCGCSVVCEVMKLELVKNPKRARALPQDRDEMTRSLRKNFSPDRPWSERTNDMCHHRGAVCAPAGLVFRCEKDTWRGADAIRSWRGDGVLGVLLGAPCWDALDAPARGAPRGVVLGISRGVRARGTRDVARGVPRGVALGVTLGIGGGHVLTSGARFGRGDRTTYMCVGAPWSTCGLSSGSRGSIAR